MKTPRFLTKRLVTVALMAAFATVALAQGPDGQGPPMGRPGGRRPGGRMGGPQAPDRLPPMAQLALRPEVAAELALSEDQKSAIEEAIQAMRESMRPPEPGGEGERPDPQAMRAARDKAEAALDAKVQAILSADQATRLGEIQVQSMGLAAALVPSVQAKLGLSDGQKAKLKALLPARGQGGPGGPGGQGGPGGPPPDGMGGGPGGPPPGGMDGGPGGQGGPGGPGGPGGRGGPGGGRNDARRQAMEAKIATILTADQKAALKALGGKTIKLAPPNRRGGPGGPGGDMNTPPPAR